jgi:hypothetical protein
MLPPADRLVGSQLHRYIKDMLYWVLHAPRQTGKTTFLQSWAREINSGEEAVACYVSVEDCQGVTNSDKAMLTIYQDICDFAKFATLPVPSVAERNPEGLLRSTSEVPFYLVDIFLYRLLLFFKLQYFLFFGLLATFFCFYVYFCFGVWF